MLHDRIMSMVITGRESAQIDVPGGIFVRRSDQISDEDKILMQTVARIVITDIGSLAKQMERKGYPKLNIPDLRPSVALEPHTPNAEAISDRSLIFNNGIGGFTNDGVNM
jgi:hypothetical protein